MTDSCCFTSKCPSQFACEQVPKKIQRAIDEHPDFGQTQCGVGQQRHDELFPRFASTISGTLFNTHMPATALAKSCGRSFCLQRGNFLQKGRVIFFNRQDSTREHPRKILATSFKKICKNFIFSISVLAAVSLARTLVLQNIDPHGPPTW